MRFPIARPRSTRLKPTKMLLLAVDNVKCIVLIALLSICLYSAVSKFAFPPTAKLATISRNYSVCNKVDLCTGCTDRNTMKILCLKEVSEAYTNAEQRCKGYLKNYTYCRSAAQYGARSCKVEQSSIDGCVASVTSDAFVKWRSPEKINFP